MRTLLRQITSTLRAKLYTKTMTPEFNHTVSDSDLTITPEAREQLTQLWKQIDDDTIEAIRIFVSGGGCSGMTYGMTFTDRRMDFDLVKSEDTFTIYIDAIAINYLRGVEIAYEVKPHGATFVFNNVFTSTGGSGTCGGCGAAHG